MIIEIKLKLKNEDGSKTLQKVADPCHDPITLSPEDPVIKALLEEGLAEFDEPVDDVIVFCKLTL